MENLSTNIRELIRSVAEPQEGEVSGPSGCECMEDDKASELTLQTPDSLAEMVTFVICGHKIPYNEKLNTHKFSYNLSKKEVNAIENVWSNKDVLYDEVNGIMKNHTKKDLPFNLFRYILMSVPKIGYSKAGLVTQILLGYLGCFDHEGGVETDSVDTSTKAYNNFMRMMQRNADDPDYKDIWKNWLNIVGSRSDSNLTENTKKIRIFESDKGPYSVIGRKKHWGSEINSMVVSDR